MKTTNLLTSPLAAVRAFGAILPAIIEEDPEGAKGALQAAALLAAGLDQWADYPFESRDAAYARVAAMFRTRLSQSALSPADVLCLGDLCLKAGTITQMASLNGGLYDPAGFNSACDELENTWRLESRGLC